MQKNPITAIKVPGFNRMQQENNALAFDSDVAAHLHDSLVPIMLIV